MQIHFDTVLYRVLECDGSDTWLQISNIRIIKEAMREASFLYAELAGLGAPMQFCDVGGGLAIDYEVPIHRICNRRDTISQHCAPYYV